MKTKSIDEIVKELEDRQEAVNTEVKDLNLKIEMQDAAIREHEREMASASDRGDVGEYVASKQELQAAKDEKEMYTTRRDKLTVAPLITEEEYNKTTREIKDAMGDRVAQTTKDVDKVFNSLNPYYNELKEDVEKTNDALQIAFKMRYPGDNPLKPDGAHASPERYRGHNDLMIRIKNATGRENERDF